MMPKREAVIEKADYLSEAAGNATEQRNALFERLNSDYGLGFNQDEDDLTRPENSKAREKFLAQCMENIRELKPYFEEDEFNLAGVSLEYAVNPNTVPKDYWPRKKKIVKRIKTVVPKPIEQKQYLKPIKKIIKTGPITKQEFYELHPEKKLEVVLDYKNYRKPESQSFYKRAVNAVKNIYNKIFG